MCEGFTGGEVVEGGMRRGTRGEGYEMHIMSLFRNVKPSLAAQLLLTSLLKPQPEGRDPSTQLTVLLRIVLKAVG